MTSRDTGGARRGRPYGSELEPVASGAMAVQRHRAAWLLRVNRLYSEDERWHRLSTFAAAFRGGCWPEPADQGKVSRWETNRIRVPRAAVQRYEEILGLVPTILTSMIDAMYWYVSPIGDGANALQVRPNQGGASLLRVNQLIEQVHSDQLMTASEWEELTIALTVALPREATQSLDWSSLTQRLVSETIISDRVWLTRFASFNRLLAHPASQAAAVDATSSLGRDRSGQIFGETVGALEGTRHPDASTQVIRQLTNPTNSQALYGALLACVRKVRYRHFSEPQLTVVMDLLAELLQANIYEDDTRLLIGELLRMSPTHQRSFVQKFPRLTVDDLALSQVLTQGRLADSDLSKAVVDRVTNSTIARMPTGIGRFIDKQLPILIDEILFSPIADVRMYSAKLVAVTPYGAQLADVLIEELISSRLKGDQDQAEAMIYALRFLGGAPGRRFVERLLVSPGLPASTHAMAARVIGHLDHKSEDTYWERALAFHIAQWLRDKSDIRSTILQRIVYALGIARNHRMLLRVRGNPDVPAPARSAASWWLNIPRHISQSALI